MKRITTLFLTFIFSISFAYSAESFSYSGRLINSNGSPVTGPVNLSFELAYSNQLGILLCSQNLNGVMLSHGVFHVKLDFPDCNLSQILAQTPDNNVVMIRVIDNSASPPKTYSFQAIYSVPFSFMSQMSKQLAQMGAVDGQVLTWNAGKWIAANPASTTNGTVTSLTATDGLYGGTITDSGIIGLSDGGVTASKLNQMGAASGQVLKWNGLSWAPAADIDSAEVDPTVRAFARTDVTGITPEICANNQTLRFISVDSSLRCFDLVQDAIVATEDKLAPSQKAVATALDLKQDEIQSTTDLKLKTITLTNADSSWIGLQAPAGSGNFFYTLPGAAGTSGQFLKTDGAGNLVWDTPSVGSSNIAAGSINDTHISSISTSKITGLDGQLSAINTSLSNIEDTVRNTDLLGLTPTTGSVTASDTVKTSIEKIVGNVSALQGAQSDYLLKTGGALSGDLSLGSNALTDLVDPVDQQDAATKKYVDDEITAASYWTKAGFDLSYLAGSVDIGNKLRLKSTTANFLEFKAPDAMGANKTYIFPASDAGSSGYALTTNGSGTLAWSPFVTASTTLGGDLSGNIGNAQLVANSVGTNEIADATVTNAKLSLTDGAIPQAKVQNLVTDLSNKEPKIDLHATPAGKYWDGNKTWQVLNTTAVSEGTNKYFTETRVQSTVLNNYVVQPSSVLSAADSLILALGKLQGQISSNDAELSTLNSKGIWEKNGSKIYYNSDYVGIGTSTPSEKLTIFGNQSRILFRAATPDLADSNSIDFSEDNTGPHFKMRYDGNQQNGNHGRMTFLAPIEGKDIMTFERSGNVGVGTTTPNSLFQVGVNSATTGSFEFHHGQAQGAFRFTSNATANWIQSGLEQLSGSAKDLSFAPYSSTSAYMTIKGDSGKVGINNTNPTAQLDVSSTGGEIIVIRDNDSLESDPVYTSYIRAKDSAGTNVWYVGDGSSAASGLWLLNYQAKPIHLATSGSSRLTVDGAGNVGIGTQSPTEKLEVVGDVKATNFKGTLNGFKMAAGEFVFANGACGNTVATACSIPIGSGGFTVAPACTITMRNRDATSYTEKMVIKETTTTTLTIWRGNYPDAGTTMQGYWTCMGQ